MSTRPQIGGNIYNEQLEDLQAAAQRIRESLDQLVDEPGPHTRAILIARAALALTKIQTSINQLQSIGRDAKKN